MSWYHGALLAILMGGTLAACDQDGPAEDLGESIDESADEVGDAAEDAAD